MIRVFTAQQKVEWNAAVKSFADYEVFYLNEYATAFMNEDGANGTPVLLLYENGQDRAMNVAFIRDVAKDPRFSGKISENEYFDLITPYGYGGFIGTVTDYDSLTAEYNAYCREHNYVCEFVRFSLFGEYFRHYDGHVQSASHNVVRDLGMSVDEMWMDFKQKVRKNVKRAVASGLEIITENTDEHLSDFLDIYYSTMTRCEAKDSFYFSRQFFEKLNEMRDNITYFHALHEGKVISTELVIFGAENAYSYLGGTDQTYFDLRPNDFLKFEIIKWCREKGLKNFVLGGGYGADDGIFQYKYCFAPKGVMDFYTGKKILDEEKYKKLCAVRDIEPQDLYEGFFPAYRT